MEYKILLLREHPELSGIAAEWFSSKWRIPKAAYEESIAECLKNFGAVPQWYLVFADGGNIAAGLGVIENDFHKPPTLLRISAQFLSNRSTASAALQK